MPTDFIERLSTVIVGFEIVIDTIKGKRKLSQNRSLADRAGVIAGLLGTGTPGAAQLAQAMIEFNTIDISHSI